MKKFSYQITIALIFLLLGYMLTTQISTINKQTISENEEKTNPEIIIENEHLRKQKEELEKEINELNGKAKEFEEAAAGRTEESKLLLQELQQTRLQTGSVDVKGEGITIYITPKKNLFANDIKYRPMTGENLLGIVNELNAADAEAISINDIRLTSRSGIRDGGDNIIINNERISPQQRVVIKAIGNKKLLEQAVNFPGAIPDGLLKLCDVDFQTSDEVIIKKTSVNPKFDYAKQVENK
ncbi:MAG: DUF881 domain-containing protein [Clostridium argentinense]|uniref:DUF881 domain-containing protein n=1 Tax=Clostridium faecium TaxID=2762223 RepID=A0ABR8YQE3_9CLOT|nr:MULTISPECIES: DUF881 domain-containing protein [Clostridium]MBD8046470.1 DUF881 domain-containing protein [Clostridium faecium]MBS5823190.1 DUF881 domain-containing protein [Clostridium argentinense]MDU1348984.1 DUF881 domain-containing protein [Clostridium argentinense]